MRRVKKRLSLIFSQALSPAEPQRLLGVANRPGWAGQPPSPIVPRLADRGESLASEATFYRVLRAADPRAHRGKAKAPSHHRPQAWVATGPHPLWSGESTDLAGAVAGLFFYLYLILEGFSRKIVGWEIHTEQTSDHAAVLFRQAHLREGVAAHTLVLHADNGSPMKGATLRVTLQRLGVVPSFSRPAVSHDNPYSEALFKTCQYRSGFPEQPFASLEQARTGVAGFVRGDNDEHRHRGIRFVTPGERHRGDDGGSWNSARQSTKLPVKPIPNAGPAPSVTGSAPARSPSTQANQPLRRRRKSLT